ncbi:hypothetical protein JOD43_001702 [Pullulanibacillus pueri]|uniref:YceG-like family protein n=1 Tax=Pullulanibacillus pueri TaxID=1437324 RepID=A0A8J3EL64_9BACL|nr:endolytic transglycosylase MltG [Pullulanibacillus pueri]MBM7681535.1 hypothetical protein [Pullulanibacillus pueri]GGH79769.1 hypothetical protein GCM10007096_15190 [Pullulanibacillus pueri]
MTKNGMRAFAAGMIITCAVIAFFYYFMLSDTGQAKKATSKTLSDSAVEDYLAKKGQIAVDQKTFNAWQKAETEKDSKQDSKASDEKSTDQKDQSTAKSDEKSKTDDKDASETKPTKVKIHIKSGMTSTDIADQLESEHIIKKGQADDLVHYIVKNGLEKYIQLGTYTVSSDMSLAEIAKTIAKER